MSGTAPLFAGMTPPMTVAQTAVGASPVGIGTAAARSVLPALLAPLARGNIAAWSPVTVSPAIAPAASALTVDARVMPSLHAAVQSPDALRLLERALPDTATVEASMEDMSPAQRSVVAGAALTLLLQNTRGQLEADALSAGLQHLLQAGPGLVTGSPRGSASLNTSQRVPPRLLPRGQEEPPPSAPRQLRPGPAASTPAGGSAPGWNWLPQWVRKAIEALRLPLTQDTPEDNRIQKLLKRIAAATPEELAALLKELAERAPTLLLWLLSQEWFENALKKRIASFPDDLGSMVEQAWMDAHEEAYLRAPPVTNLDEHVELRDGQPTLNVAGLNLMHCENLATGLAALRERYPRLQIDMRDAHGEGVNLAGADLHGARLDDGYFSAADLSGANLSGASMIGLDGQDAFFVDADLRDAKLHGAQLSSADFSRAELMRADLTSATLSQARFDDAKLVGARIDGSQLRAFEQSDGTYRALMDSEIEHLLDMGHVTANVRDSGVRDLFRFAVVRQSRTTTTADPLLYARRLRDLPEELEHVYAGVKRAVERHRALAGGARNGGLMNERSAAALAKEADPLVRACLKYFVSRQAVEKTEAQWQDRQEVLRDNALTLPVLADLAPSLGVLHETARAPTMADIDEHRRMAQVADARWGLSLPLTRSAPHQNHRERLRLQQDVLDVMNEMARALAPSASAVSLHTLFEQQGQLEAAMQRLRAWSSDEVRGDEATAAMLSAGMDLLSSAHAQLQQMIDRRGQAQ